jgi:hypothetical protein
VDPGECGVRVRDVVRGADQAAREAGPGGRDTPDRGAIEVIRFFQTKTQSTINCVAAGRD